MKDKRFTPRLKKHPVSGLYLWSAFDNRNRCWAWHLMPLHFGAFRTKKACLKQIETLAAAGLINQNIED